MNEEEKTTATETAEEVKSEEVKEVDAVESDKTVENDKTDEKKGGFWKDVKKGFGDFWNKSKKFVKDSADTVSDYFSAQQEINALNSIFEDEAKKFTDVKTGKTRYALVADDGTLTFRKDGDGTVLNLQNDEIVVGTHLSADGKVYEITAVDKETDVSYKKTGNSRSLDCFTATARQAE